jgi:hypothetical protein
MSTAGGRQIACSLMGLNAAGGVDDPEVVTPDSAITERIAVITNSSVGAVRFTGAEGDAWKVS